MKYREWPIKKRPELRLNIMAHALYGNKFPFVR